MFYPYLLDRSGTILANHTELFGFSYMVIFNIPKRIIIFTGMKSKHFHAETAIIPNWRKIFAIKGPPHPEFCLSRYRGR